MTCCILFCWLDSVEQQSIITVCNCQCEFSVKDSSGDL